MRTGDWYCGPDHGQFYQVIETQTLWGETIWVYSKENPPLRPNYT